MLLVSLNEHTQLHLNTKTNTGLTIHMDNCTWEI